MRVFDPWVGSKYWSTGYGGVRVLILGESHYGDIGTESATFTTEVVKKWGQDNRLKFFYNYANARCRHWQRQAGYK